MPTGQRPLPPPHSIHLAVLGNVQDAPFANTFWVRNGNAQVPTQGDLTSFTSNFGLYFKNRLLPHLSNHLQLQEITALYYDAAGAELAAAVSDVSIGLEGGTAMPANVSLCIGWRVQQHYRGGHPRTYLAGIPTSKLQTPRLYDPAWVATTAQAASDFHGDVINTNAGAIQGAKLGVVSFVNRKEWRSPPVFRDFVYPSAHADQRIDSMRRRLGHDIAP